MITCGFWRNQSSNTLNKYFGAPRRSRIAVFAKPHLLKYGVFFNCGKGDSDYKVWHTVVKLCSQAFKVRTKKLENKMARYFENTTTFNFSWDQVARGYWKRYPNPLSTHVLSEDTCSRQVKDGCLYSKRLLTKTNRVPKWGERFFSAKSVKIIEESIVDPEKKVLITYTRNLGYTKVMSVVERVEYRPSGPGQTVARRSAWIDSQVFGFSRAIRAFGLDRFRKNCNQMVNGFNHVLHSMYPRQVPPHMAPVTHTLKEMRDAAAAATDRAKRNVLSSVQRS